MRNKLLAVSQEAISHQDGTFFRELTAAFETFKAGGNFTENAIEQLKLEDLVKRHTKLNVVVQFDGKAPYANAWVSPPQVDKNHPLVADFYREYIGNKEGVAAIRKTGKGFIQGWVDRTKGIVGGAFTEFTSTITLTKPLFDGAIEFSASEIAAILLHEIGHVFTYFECIGDQLATNYQLSAITKALLGTSDLTVRVTLIKEAETAMGIKIDDHASVSRINSGEVLQTVIIDSKVRAQRSEFGSYYYDLRNWESLSDQFAIRHQSHLALVTAFDKMYRAQGHTSTMSTPRFLMTEAFKCVLTIVGSVIVPVLVVFLLIQDPFLDTYDRPVERIKRVRQDLVSALKEPGVNKERSACILGELAAIDSIVATMQDRTTLWENVWKVLSPSIRGQQRKIQDIKVLEELANNELYVHAAALRTHA